MTKMRLSPVREAAQPRRAIRPWLFNLGVLAMLAYVAWLFYRTPALPGLLYRAVLRSLGL